MYIASLFVKMFANNSRLFLSVTPALSCLLLMSTLPWAVVTRRMVSMFPVW
jgi:hypothetical protein